MTKYRQTPEGKTVGFPDDMDDSAISAVFRKKFPSQKEQDEMDNAVTTKLKENDIFSKIGMKNVPDVVRNMGAPLLENIRTAGRAYESTRPNHPVNLFQQPGEQEPRTLAESLQQASPPTGLREDTWLAKQDPYKLLGAKRGEPFFKGETESGFPKINPAGAEQFVGEWGPAIAGGGKLLYELGKFIKKGFGKMFPKTSESVINAANELPEKIAKGITKDLSVGAKSQEQNARNMANIVNQGYRYTEKLAIDRHLKPLLNQFGSEVPYKKVVQTKTERIPSKILNEKGEPANYQTKVTKGEPRYDVPDFNPPQRSNELKSSYNKWKQNPDIKSSQDFQSDIRKKSNEIFRNANSSHADREYARYLEKYANDILDKMGGHFKTKGKVYNDKYQAFRDSYSQKKSYEKAGIKLKKMATGENMNPENPHLAFKHPSDVITREGKEKIGNINMVRNHMPKSFDDMIMFSKMGGHNLTPEQLLSNFKKASDKGYAEYVSPKLSKQMKELEESLESQKAMEKIVKEEEKTRYESSSKLKKAGNLGLKLLGFGYLGHKASSMYDLMKSKSD